MPRRSIRALLFPAFVFALACESPSVDQDAGEQDAGDAGSAECTSTFDCPGALVCEDGVCQREGCEPGSEACRCAAGDRCGRGADGDPLVCMDGVCSSMTCPAGRSGCVCLNGEECTNEGDHCQNGYCVAADCLPGDEGCSCVAGTCEANLHCLDGALCVDDDGYEGGPCLPTGRCHAGARCDPALSVCVSCVPGTAGCSCSGRNGCNTGLACVADVCVDAHSLPPAEPRCYTPCRESLDHVSPVRECDSDGLMDGCVGELSCVEGSCIAAGETPPTCSSDLDCPFFQTCLSGQCYSNCRNNVDCPSGLGCHQRVCRVPCESTAGAATCGAGYFCDARDGENGYCVQLPDASSGGPSTTHGGTGGFEIDRSMLELSNVRTRGELRVTVGGASGRDHDFTIRRLSHVVTRTDGTVERVEAERNPSTGELLPCDAVRGECPLSWLDIAIDGAAASRDPEVSFRAAAGCEAAGTCPVIAVSNAAGVAATRWQGTFEIAGNGGRATITLTYVERPEGRWSGTMYYFGNFPTGGLDLWRARADRSDVTGVQNGFVARWGAFRRGNLTDGWREMKAVLTSTETESWALSSVAERCPYPNGACYPYTNTSGVRNYVTSLAATPLPRGVTELPFALSVRQSGMSTVLTGRVESSASLHYPGNPAVSIELAADPADSSACSPMVSTDCVVPLESIEVISIVGGRYPSPDGRCDPGYQAVREPHLVEGFTAGTTLDEAGRRYRTWCVDAELPYGDATPADVAANRSLAGGNPVPDGIARRRTLRLLDGALVNQSELFFLFEETFDTFVDDGSTTVSSYGYVLLHRQPADLDETDADGDGIADIYQGTQPPTGTRTAPLREGASCDPELVLDILGGSTADPTELPPDDLDLLTDVLIWGTRPDEERELSRANVHYYCEETGLFDGGPNDDGSASAVRIACPLGSRVVFFSTTARTQAQIAAEPCQQDVRCTAEGCTGGTCQTTLNLWQANGIIDVYEPYYRCDQVGGVETPYCDEDRLDLRSNKTFYRPAASATRTFIPLQSAIESAFRYRTRFTSSRGTRPGFAPQICIPDSDQIPYCYDPPVIEEIRGRVDCLIALYADDALIDSLSDPQRHALQTFLRGDFARFEGSGRDGFERLYAELLVMMGDEALTQAFASRFDLAAAGGASFEGSLLEPGGIDLSGVAGFEMVSLYRAVQLYQMALDRLYKLGPDLTEALSRNESIDSALVFVSPESVTLYLERLIRASTQRALAYSEIASRYQLMNRADLARSVVQRAYISAYLESVILSQLMYAIADRSTRADRPQIDLTVTQALRRYRLALLDMRDLYGTITDEIDYFGFPPDFIPFPPLDESARGRNAFEVMFDIAQSRVTFARNREDQALASNRTFQTDTAQFQAELVRLKNTYEGQLAELCGTFEADDGRIYPAIRRYASQSRLPEQLGDPCGMLGNGQIHNALVAVQQAATQQEILQTRMRNLLEEVEIERQRVSAQCELIDDVAEFQYRSAGQTLLMSDAIAGVRLTAELGRQTAARMGELTAAATCAPDPTNPGFCAAQLMQGSIRASTATAQIAITAASEAAVMALQHEIGQIERETARWVTRTQCDQVTIDSNARTATILLGLRELELEMLRNYRDLRLQLSEVGRLYNEAQRRQMELAESEELVVAVEAARNDPNVRIYRNDAVLNADIAFQDALRAVYRATRVLEYYTSQSYPRLDQLFLIRMVGAGEYNLENYLVELHNAFIEFEELHGAPDTRVMVLSMRDDVMQIPRLGEGGRALSEAERIELMRQRLADVDLLDENGYLVLPFRTDFAALSPLTRNHKIAFIETDVVGSNVGDRVGRVYLRPRGTGVIHGIDGELDYYLFPQRTAVINAFFNGNRVFTPEVYRAERLRDRPLVNTQWDLVINQRDEVVNQDIDLQSLSDIRLIMYYDDFTVF